jgi:transcriptional repressor NrdR
MQCPFCGKDSDKVVDSRGSEGGCAVRRRRQCLACGRRYTTYERAEETIRLTVVKKDRSREPYDRNKLLLGLQKACFKRPVTDEQLRAVIEQVEERIFQVYDREVPSNFVGDAVSEILRTLDKIAYIRFASVYREFADVGELIDEARGVKDVPSYGPEQRTLFQSGEAEKKNDKRL